MNPETIEQHRRAVQRQPRNAHAHAQLGVALQQAGQFEQAVASQRRALELDPGLTGLHAVMAHALLALGRHAEAAESFRVALRAQPGNPSLHKSLSEALLHAHQLDAARESAARAVELDPAQAEFHLHLAAVDHARCEYKGAAASFQRALAIDPGRIDARLDLAGMLYNLKRYDEAAEHCREVLKFQPASFAACLNLANNLQELKQLDEALALYQRALALEPEQPAALLGLGVTLKLLDRFDEALAALTRLDELQPGVGVNLTHLAFVQLELGQRDQAVQALRSALDLDHSSSIAHDNLVFTLSHCCNDPAELFAAHLHFGECFEGPYRDHWTPHPNPRDPQRRLRIGFVSADLCNHAVASFIEPIFAILKDSTQLELHAYYNNVTDDWVSQRMREHIPDWHPIANLDDDAVERQIRADGIDILVDLSGHSALNRLTLFARKPAPIQASWIGYAGTTGLQAMDYYLSDQFHLPEGRYDGEFTEKIVRLPLSAPFTPSSVAPPLNPLPALSNGYLTFGSFHRMNKLSRSVIAQWSRLLRALPDAKLLMGGLHKPAQAVVLAWFADEGIAPERLLLHGRTTMPEYLALHHQVDICLSPFPYTGSTTICHALWMGVPTLTTVGPTNPSHSVVCYLAHLGLSSFIAEDDDTLVNLGVFLSQNLAELAGLRATMRERFNTSVVGYPGVAAAGLEYAFRAMWKRWCAGEPAAPIRVRLSDLVSESEQEKNP